jgi:transposase InsO family protein
MDNATCYTVVYLLRTKDQVLKSYKSFEAWAIAQQHCNSIKVLHSDCGGEYLSNDFDKHLVAAGIARCLTTHDTLQLNGIAKQLNQMLLKHVHALWHEACLSKMLWGEALCHATWLKNRTAMCALDAKMPFEALFGTPPNLSVAHLWGCKV